MLITYALIKTRVFLATALLKGDSTEPLWPDSTIRQQTEDRWLRQEEKLGTGRIVVI